MKRLFVLMVVCVLLTGSCAALAADWTEGRSAAQPYAGVPAVDLNTTIGYIMMAPRAKLPVDHFCNTLQIYLPREDVAVGKGKLMLYASQDGGRGEQVESIDFENSEAVVFRPMTEAELESLIWGGGTCIEIHLSVSLAFDRQYYVLMEEGCFTAAGGKVTSPSIGNPAAWVPVMRGDYGVANLFYSEAPEVQSTPTVTATEEPVYYEDGNAPEYEPDPTPEPTPEATITPASASVVKLTPSEGDYITFDIVLGGDAATAVLYSENDSVLFANPEYDHSTTVCGTVLMPNIKLGVVFLDANGQVLDVVNLTR